MFAGAMTALITPFRDGQVDFETLDELLEFQLEGDLDLHAFLGLSDKVRPGYEQIRLTYRVKSNAPREKLEALCEYVQRTSPVLDLLRNPVPVLIDLVD